MGFRARVSHHRPPCRAVERTCNAAMKLTYKAIRQPGIPHSVVIGAPGFLVGSGMNSGLPSCRTSGRRRALGFEPTNCTQRHAVLRMPAAERACVELGRLATHPRQTRGSLVSPLLARAGSRFAPTNTKPRVRAAHSAMPKRGCLWQGALAPSLEGSPHALGKRGLACRYLPRPCWLEF